MEIREQDLVCKPNIIWEGESHSLAEIVEKYTLPRILQCATEFAHIRLDEFNFDFKQPLLMYKKRHVKKIRARSLGLHPIKRTSCHVGDPLLIPEDYKGWFVYVSSTGENVSSTAIPVYDSIEELAKSSTAKFLIGGSTAINALQIVNCNGDNGFQQRQCSPGDVLKKSKSYVAQTKKKTIFFKKSKIVEEKFLKCCDEHGRMLLIPYKANGTFYQVNSHNMGNGLQRIHKIIQKKQLPCVVKLVFGKPPATPCAFTGDLQLDCVIEETSLIGSTVFNLRNIMFEFNVDSPLEFFVANEQIDIKSSHGYRNAVRLCSEQGDLFMRNIKITYSLDDEFGSNPRHIEVNPSSDSVNQKLSRQTVAASSQCSARLRTPHNVNSFTQSSPPGNRPPPLPHKSGVSCTNSPMFSPNICAPSACPGNSAKQQNYIDMSNVNLGYIPNPTPCNSSRTSSESSTHNLPSPHHKSTNSRNDNKDDDFHILPDCMPNSGITHTRSLPSPHRKTVNTNYDNNGGDVGIETERNWQLNASLPREMLERTFLQSETQTEIQSYDLPVYENLEKIREIITCDEKCATNIECDTHSTRSCDSTTSLTNLSNSGSFGSDASSFSNSNDSTGSTWSTCQSSIPECPSKSHKLILCVDRLCQDSLEHVRDSGIQDSYSDLQSMNACELIDRLNEMGVKSTTLRYLADKQIDGCVVSCMYNTDQTLKEHLPAYAVSEIDRTKIITFIENIN